MMMFSKVFLILTVLVMYSSFSFATITYSDPTIITTIICNNDQIVLNNTNISFINTNFQINGNCVLRSLVGNYIVPISSITTAINVLNKLTLQDIVLKLNGDPLIQQDFNDFQIEMNEVSSSILFNGLFKFKYSLLVENSILLQGGSIQISVGSRVTLENINSYISQLSINSDIINFNIFEVVGFCLNLGISEFHAKPLSFNYFYQGIVAQSSTTSPPKTLEFLDCTVLIGKLVNLAGGTLSLSNTQYLTTNIPQYNYFHNTNIVINTLSTVNLYHDPSSLLNGWRLDSSSSLKLLQGINSIAFKITTLQTVFVTDLTEDLIYSASDRVDCGSNYINNANTVTFKAMIPGPIRLTGFTMCSKSGISSNIYITNQYMASSQIIGCPDGFYTCLSLLMCIPVNQPCSSPVCQGNDNLVNPPYNGDDAKCWNGECAKFKPYNKCSTPYTPCPRATPYRCAGVCVVTSSQCPDESSCLTACVDGCYNETRLCQPFNGCPLHHYQCPNDDCVTDASLCTTETTNLPFSNRFLDSTDVKIYSSIPEVASMLFKERDSNLLYGTANILITSPPNPSSNNINTITIKPVSDSVALAVNGQSLKPNFNYFKDLLTAPFTMAFNSQTTTTFTDPVTIYFSIPQIPNLSNIPLCLAFANSLGNWECTPFTPQLVSNNSAVLVKTTFFNSFFALLTIF